MVAIKSLLLLDIDGTLVNGAIPLFSFKDVVESLPLLSEKYELGFFSQGMAWFQLAKIKFHGYERYFSKDQVYIGFNKLALLDKIASQNQGRQITIVDNRVDMVRGVESNGSGIKAVLIDRNNKHPDYNGAKIRGFLELLSQ